MKRVKGTYNGSAVVLREKVEIPANTEVEVLIPEARDESLTALLDQLDRLPSGEVLSPEEVVALVHGVRASQR